MDEKKRQMMLIGVLAVGVLGFGSWMMFGGDGGDSDTSRTTGAVRRTREAPAEPVKRDRQRTERERRPPTQERATRRTRRADDDTGNSRRQRRRNDDRKKAKKETLLPMG